MEKGRRGLPFFVGRNRAARPAFSSPKESMMATQPEQPAQPTQAPPEVAPPQHDVDVPSPAPQPAAPGIQPPPD